MPTGFVNFDTPVAGLNTQRQVHFPPRPSSVVGQQDDQEAQPKRTFTTLRRPLGQPKGIVGKTLSIHQQILPTGFKPINRSLSFPLIMLPLPFPVPSGLMATCLIHRQ